jgi:hypothetical protein
VRWRCAGIQTATGAKRRLRQNGSRKSKRPSPRFRILLRAHNTTWS